MRAQKDVLQLDVVVQEVFVRQDLTKLVFCEASEWARGEFQIRFRQVVEDVPQKRFGEVGARSNSSECVVRRITNLLPSSISHVQGVQAVVFAKLKVISAIMLAGLILAKAKDAVGLKVVGLCHHGSFFGQANLLAFDEQVVVGVCDLERKCLKLVSMSRTTTREETHVFHLLLLVGLCIQPGGSERALPQWPFESPFFLVWEIESREEKVSESLAHRSDLPAMVEFLPVEKMFDWRICLCIACPVVSIERLGNIWIPFDMEII